MINLEKPDPIFASIFEKRDAPAVFLARRSYTHQFLKRSLNDSNTTICPALIILNSGKVLSKQIGRKTNDQHIFPSVESPTFILTSTATFPS